jgi:hypothetical protein
MGRGFAGMRGSAGIEYQVTKKFDNNEKLEIETSNKASAKLVLPDIRKEMETNIINAMIHDIKLI